MAVDKETRSCDCASLGGPRCALPVCSDRLPAEEICLNEVEKSFLFLLLLCPRKMSCGDAFGCSSSSAYTSPRLHSLDSSIGAPVPPTLRITNTLRNANSNTWLYFLCSLPIVGSLKQPLSMILYPVCTYRSLSLMKLFGSPHATYTAAN